MLALCSVLTLAGCAEYSTVSTVRPAYRFRPLTAAGELIAQATKSPLTSPEKALGAYIDAAAVASRQLEANSSDADALRDYNYAVARVIELVDERHLRPWAAPIRAEGKDGTWEFTMADVKRAGRTPDDFDLVPADRYRFRGTYVDNRATKDGLGAPLVVTSHADINVLESDKFAQGKHIYYGITAVLKFEGRKCRAEILDPLSVETVRTKAHTYPLAADFTAPIAVALAKENPKKLELTRLLDPEKFAHTARLARLQPYDPTKIPVVCVHGLMDSPATWTPLIVNMRADPEIRQRYQFWFYSYPSGYPYPHSAAIMRQQLDEIGALYPGHKKLVLIGHSMGGVISRTMITDSGMKLWNAVFSTPPSAAVMHPDARKVFADALIFKQRSDVGRVIFISAPHRGSTLASNWMGRIGSSLVRSPVSLLKLANEARKLMLLDTSSVQSLRLPNSIDTLSPTNRFVRAISEIPPSRTIPYHSIMGDRGKGGNKDHTEPVSSDGIVPYWSSHLDGAKSELIVPSTHSAHQNPQAIEEVRRILKLHAGVGR